MGYRNYLAKMSKSVYLEIKDITEEELSRKFGNEEDNFVWYEDIGDYKELHELGKYCDFDIEDKKERFFTHKMSWEEDVEFFLASKELLLQIIEEYRQKVVGWYKMALKKNHMEMRADIEGMMVEWTDFKPYDLNEEKNCIVTSWKYEYSIFELVRILKSFDWKNDVLLYVGS